MNKLFIAPLLAAGLAFSAIAQENIQVDVTKLNQQQLQVYQQLKTMQNSTITLDNLSPEKIDKYAQIGKAFGSAFKECWTTVSTDAERFANSSAGKWAMVLVSWKIMGEDATRLVEKSIQFAVGGFLLVIGIPFWIFFFRRNCIVRPEVASVEKLGWFRYKVTYGKTYTPPHCDESMLLYGVCLAAFIGICAAIMFIG